MTDTKQSTSATVPALTKEQAVIVSAYTGVLCGSMSDLHGAIEQKLGRPVWTHQLGGKEIWHEIKSAFRDDFVAIAYKPSAPTASPI